MLCGTRRDEIANLQWDEVDLDNALITFGPARTKNKRSHEISLSAPALAMLQSVPRRDSPDGYVFGRGCARVLGLVEGQRPSLDARILAARQAASEEKSKPMSHWTPHDFRRSMSTTMHERLGIQPHIVEACLGHTGTFRSGVASVYNRFELSNRESPGMDALGCPRRCHRQRRKEQRHVVEAGVVSWTLWDG